ncbi:hypothetical protein B6U84_00070 [Candidatus Bathyarchaeota archaeon ex4484_40]|nr:MAG: hypothetical protein B6U84_00070 [Candidatus Bathyarchaeota archaeon ex4484_40]
MSKERVVINGFLLDCEVPSEERLTMRVDLSRMPGYKHVDWVSSLQDLLRAIDQDYRERHGIKKRSRGRSVRVRYVKDEEGNQRKVALFQPYPSLIVNALKELRRAVYGTLNMHCIILQEERVGRMKRKLYFLPAGAAPKLMAQIEEFNKRLEGIKSETRMFENSKDFQSIMEHVKEAGDAVEEFHPDLSRIRVSPVPLSLSRSFFEQYLEEERRKALVEIDEARRRGLEALEREIEAKRREMLEAIERDLRGRFATLLEATERAVKNLNRRGAKILRRNFDSLLNLVGDIGVEFDERPFKALGSVLEAAEDRDPDALIKSVNELAESLGIEPTGNPERDLNMAVKAVKGESLLLFTLE